MLTLTYEEKLNIVTAACIFIITCIAGIGAFVYLWDKKPVVIESASEENVIISEVEYYALKMESGEDGKLVIKLPNSAQDSDVSFQYDYNSGLMTLEANCSNLNHYKTSVIKCDEKLVKSGGYTVLNHRAYLQFETSAFYTPECNVSGDEATISFKRPSDVYSMVVLLDVDYSNSAKDILFPMVKSVAAKLGHSDIGVYISGQSDSCPYETDADTSDNLRGIYLGNVAERLGADFVLSFGTESLNENEFGIRGYWDNQFYSSKITNVSLMSKVAKNLAQAVNNKVAGISDVWNTEDRIYLTELTIPSGGITIGNVNNEKEMGLLLDERYTETMATAIADSIKEIYEENYIRNKK